MLIHQVFFLGVSKISIKFFVEGLFCWFLTCVYHIYWISINWSWNFSLGVIGNCHWGVSKTDMRLVVEEIKEWIGRIFSAYGTPLTAVSSFRYLGRMLLSSNDNWVAEILWQYKSWVFSLFIKYKDQYCIYWITYWGP